MSEDANRIDLGERTAAFGDTVLEFAESLPDTPKTRTLREQLARASAGVGDSYEEVSLSESPADFKHRSNICRKEIRETVRWLRMLIEAAPEASPAAQAILQEAKELNLMLSASGLSGPPAPPARPAGDPGQELEDS
jgi:four helix bundle protein